MSIDLSRHRPAASSARRERLARSLDGLPALLPAGGPIGRNYPANVYPFRAGSHFLYYVGLPLEDAFLLVERNACTLFVPRPHADDELWHGPTPSFADLAKSTGCRVRARDELGDAIGGRTIATLAAPDAATRAFQSALLGREIAPGTLVSPDDQLADAVIEQRLAHDDAAVAEMRRAAEATAEGHVAAMGVTRAGILEAEVLAAYEQAFARRDMTHAYGPIVTVHGEILHARTHAGTLAPGDLVLADVGAESDTGWASDVTRTWPVSGKFSPTQRDVYSVVLAAQKEAVASVRPVARYRDIHLGASRALVRGLVELGVFRGDLDELVADGVHAVLFPHGIGHLLGLDVHDMEDLGDRAGYAKGRSRSAQFGLSYLRLDRDLLPGMAVTIEPGLYKVPAILAREDLHRAAKDRIDWEKLAQLFADVRGIRIEDDVLVTANGHEVLTAAIPKELADVEARVGRTAEARA